MSASKQSQFLYAVERCLETGAVELTVFEEGHSATLQLPTFAWRKQLADALMAEGTDAGKDFDLLIP